MSGDRVVQPAHADAGQALALIGRATFDPGRYLPRGQGEALHHWQARAVLAAITSEPIATLDALGGIYNGTSTPPYHWWRLPIEGKFDA